jgi:phytoene dehydrogenase-like protein
MKKIVVIGSGLSGLWISHLLSQKEDHQVTLLEARDVAGGRYRRARENTPFESPDLSFFPANEAHEKGLERLRRFQPELFQAEISDHQPLTHLHGEWRAFVGFGDDAASSVPLLSQWNVNKELSFTPSAAQLVEAFLREPSFELLPRTEVTHFQVQDQKVLSVTLNGSTTLEADEFIFCPSPSQLLDLLGPEDLKSNTRSHLARASGWSAVYLRLDASEELSSDSRALRFLLGTGKEFEPAVGRIFGGHSVWMSLIPTEKAIEPDFVTGQIRAIKRVLKRHSPEILEKASKEHIFIQDDAYGELDLKLKEPGRLNEISNLWLANHRFSPLIGALGELDAAQTVVSQLFVAEPSGPVLTEQQL